MIKKFIFIIILFYSNILYSQSISGFVFSLNDNIKEPLNEAVVKWINTTKGTITDEKGKFTLPLAGITDKRLVVMFTGYKTDTVDIGDNASVEITLIPNTTTSVINVEEQKKSTFFGNYNAKTEIITSQELVKEACCDLSGCFGRNSSVDVAVTDIISDSKELKLLGLEGVYTQILVDNMPLLNGLNVKYGISSIPGTQIDKITISKGSNSVLKGFESISGIVNVILKDYNNSDVLMFNGFVNSMLEKQFNLNYADKISKNINNIFSLHTTQKSNVIDHNHDGFMDNPLVTRYVLYNKWNYNEKESQTEGNIALRYWNESREGGQRSSIINHANSVQAPEKLYEQNIDINSFEAYSRFSKQFTEYSGIKLYLTSSYYDQKSNYGYTKYNANQMNFSFSGFYEFELFDESYLKTGLSYKYNNIDEVISFNDSTSKTYNGNYVKKEYYPAVFLENSYNFLESKASVMTGIRLDYHNEYKSIFTPRILIRYQPIKTLVFRASTGTGFRTVNIFNEYSNLLASSRNIIVAEKLDPEKTINYGGDILFYFGGNNFSGSLNLDFYRTQFKNKIIPDYDSNPQEIIFSNLNNKAHSNVFQAELSLTLFKNLDFKTAYKYIDLKYEKNGILIEQPFSPKHRILAVASYITENKLWSFSAGLNWYGKQRLPSTASNPHQYQMPTESEPYTIINAQINRNFKFFELYIGAENLLDFKQKNPIIAPENPFGPYFDTSFIWGPTKGREIYAGFRFIIPKN
jgi:outer membrane receptor for ferrienterochelin and colicin